MWELPYWAHELGGVLDQAGLPNTGMLNLYGNAATLTGNNSIDPDHVRRELKKQGEAAAYLFSPMTANYRLALSIADVIKDEFPDSKTIFGGVMATPLHEQTARHQSVDYVVRHAGEVALPKLLRAIERGGKDIEDIGNLTYVDENGELRVSPKLYPEIPPDRLPMPKIDLFDPEVGSGLRYLRVVHGLGCVSKCSFCTIRTIGRLPSFFPDKRVIDEIDAFRNRYSAPLVEAGYPPHNIYFGDETFTEDTDQTVALLQELERRGGYGFDAQTRLDRLQDPKIVEALAKSGCRWLEIGLETVLLDSRNRHKRGRRLKEDPQTKTLKALRDAGIATCAFTITGMSGQTVNDMRANVEGVAQLIDDDLLNATYSAVFVPYPGSELYDHPQRFGMDILHEDYSKYHEDLPPVFTTEQAPDPDAVHQVYLDGLGTLAQAMTRSKHAAKGRGPYGGSWDQGHS